VKKIPRKLRRTAQIQHFCMARAATKLQARAKPQCGILTFASAEEHSFVSSFLE
jgi:hypothetical protein